MCLRYKSDLSPCYSTWSTDQQHPRPTEPELHFKDAYADLFGSDPALGSFRQIKADQQVTLRKVDGPDELGVGGVGESCVSEDIGRQWLSAGPADPV